MRSTPVIVRYLAALMPLFLLAACTSWLPEPHKLEITQGNAIKRDQLESIRPGMTRTEVTAIIGSPTLEDPFHAQRWDYIYRHVPTEGEERLSRLTLYFDQDRLVRIDDSSYVEPAPDSGRENSAIEVERDPGQPDID